MRPWLLNKHSWPTNSRQYSTARGIFLLLQISLQRPSPPQGNECQAFEFRWTIPCGGASLRTSCKLALKDAHPQGIADLNSVACADANFIASEHLHNRYLLLTFLYPLLWVWPFGNNGHEGLISFYNEQWNCHAVWINIGLAGQQNA